MHRRTVSIAVTILALGAAACGGDDAATRTTTVVRTAAPTTTSTTHPPKTTGHATPPTDPDAALLTIDGGVPAIAADGRVFERAEGPQGFAAVPLGPAAGALTVAQLTPAGLAEVLATADELGLLDTPPDYGEPSITDQRSLTVVVSTSKGTFEHSLYAPGADTGEPDADAARERLEEFVDFVESLQMELGDEISEPEPYVPEQWVIDTSPYVARDDVEPWAFDTDPVDGCTSLPTDAGLDTASGVYSVTTPGEDTDEHIIEVSPALPFTEC